MNNNSINHKNPKVIKTLKNEHIFSKIIDSAYEKALNDISKLPDFVLNMHGMSGKKYRHLINNIIANIDDARYLEIGSWQGSTAASAIFGNKVVCTCIDNWSEFGNGSEQFYKNINYCLNDNIKLNTYEKDFRNVDYNNIGKYNIFLFDGPHEENDQYDGIVIPYNCLDDVFILIVDDWNWESSKNGTKRAIVDLKVNLLYSLEIITCDGIDSNIPEVIFENSSWHNGYYIAVCKK